MNRLFKECNPLLLKDLRRELRGPTRLIIVLAPLLLAGSDFLLCYLPADTLMGALTLGGGWLVILLPPLVLIPARAMSAFNSEHEAGQLHLLYLSRLNELEIVFGKWCAFAVLNLLFALSLTPYLLGGVFIDAEFALERLTALADSLFFSTLVIAFILARGAGNPSKQPYTEITCGALFLIVGSGGNLERLEVLSAEPFDFILLLLQLFFLVLMLLEWGARRLRAADPAAGFRQPIGRRLVRSVWADGRHGISGVQKFGS